MKKRVLTLVMALVFVLILSVPAFAFDSQAARNSVVVVYTCLDLDGGEYGFGWGTGFFVGENGKNPQYLITCYHVVEDFIDYGSGSLTTVYDEYDNEYVGRAKIRVYYDSRDYEEAYYVWGDDLKDVAVLKLGNPTNKRAAIALQSPQDDMVGDAVYAIGYPGLAENIFADATTTWGNSDATVTKGTISRLFLQSGTGVAKIQTDCDFKNGNSGGPLVTDNNTVIGVCASSVNDSGGNEIRYCINIDEVIPALNQYGVKFALGAAKAEPDEPVTPPPPVEPEKEGLPLWAIIAIIAAVVVIAVVVILAIVLSKKKSAPAAQPAPAAPAAPVYAPPQQRPAQPTRTGGVRSLSPQHRGTRVSVGQQPIVLGRGQDCAVVYQSNTPGVSGHHCQLAWDSASGDFILTDLQSTYGTYLANGQKLTPNMAYRLRSGDQFYLGERSNMLQVSVE